MTRARPDLDVSEILFELAEAAPRESWNDRFGNERTVELEIGSGKGLFLASAGARFPERNFLGVEISRKYARLAAERIAKAGLANVRIGRGDIREWIESAVPAASLAAVHVYFPDPWWKKRHKKRRVMNERLVAAAARALVPGGRLEVATDVAEYFEVIRSLISAHGGFVETPIAAPAEAEPLTNFERKYRVEGRPIHRLSCVLKPSLEASGEEI